MQLQSIPEIYPPNPSHESPESSCLDLAPHDFQLPKMACCICKPPLSNVHASAETCTQHRWKTKSHADLCDVIPCKPTLCEDVPLYR
jgi:hypothetical protein